jgi:HK97 family phage major capsid protein
MSLNELTDRINLLGHAWEQFKSVNEQRLKDIERKGMADPLQLDQLGRINHALDYHKQRLDQIETAIQRPGSGEGGYQPKMGSYEHEYKQAFCNYLRKGLDAGLEALQTKALSVGTDADGGYLVTPAMASRIVKLVQETTPLRRLASVESISTDSLEIIEDVDAAAAGWTTETGAVSDTNTPQIGKNTISVHEMYAQPKATQKLIDDSAIDIEAWVAEKVGDIFSRLESTSFISGNGTSQPKGILTYAAGTNWGQIEQINSGSAGAVTADGLIRLYYSLKEEYASRSTFLMHRSVAQSIRLLKESGTNQYLWQPGLAAGTPDTLLGAPVEYSNDMPVAANNALAVALADFRSAYMIVDRMGIRILRDPYTDKPFVKFYTTKRVGGAVVNFTAIKLQKLSA